MNIDELEQRSISEIGAAASEEELERLRIKYLGRKGEVTLVLRSLKDLPLDARRVAGPRAQALQKKLDELLAARLREIAGDAPRVSAVDLTAPGKTPARGHLNPLSLVEQEIRRIFTGLNFSVMDGPEAESEYYNFDALNIPAGHPARDMWDTFWLKQESFGGKTDRNAPVLLRTHTSPMQIRYMETHEPPFQIIVPGRCFRYEAVDASHEANFHQFEGLMVGKDVSLANFKFIIEEFFREFFKEKIEFRYRPSYFPFVEPGMEVDIKLKGKWLEVMGCGMVHRRVFEYAHYNPGEWQGFAFGAGIDRLAMIKYGVPDVRMFYSGDLRIIKQF